MDVLLIAPPEYRYVKAWTAREYLGLEYLAAFVRNHGYDVRILNCNRHATIRDVVETAVKDKPTIIGISIPTLPNLPGAFQIVRSLREAKYNGHISLGGHVATFECKDILEATSDVDTIVRGEGEHTFLELLQAVELQAPVAEVKGIALRKDGGVLINATRDLIKNVDELPFPSRDMLVEIVNTSTGSGTAAIASGRGCYGHCTFCSVHAFYKLSKGPKVRLRSPESIVDEIEDLVARFQIPSFFFIDDNFIGPGRSGKQRAATIAEEILRRELEIDFTLYCRADDVEEPLFKLLKRAGLARVFVGIESGVQSVLDRFKKGTTVEENMNAINTLRRAGITWDAGFILYDPEMTFEEFKENVSFLRSTAMYRYPAATLLLNGLTLYPGTPVESALKEEGRFKNLDEENSIIIGNAREGVEPLSGEFLKLMGLDYEIRDERMQEIRQIVDLVEVEISPQYDIIWPLFAEWRHWLDSVIEITGFTADVLKDVPEFKLHLGDQIERWMDNLGTLIINILEELADLYRDGEQIGRMEETLLEMYSLIDRYNMRHFSVKFENKMSEIKELLGRKQFEFQLNGLSYLLSMESKALALNV